MNMIDEQCELLLARPPILHDLVFWQLIGYSYTLSELGNANGAAVLGILRRAIHGEPGALEGAQIALREFEDEAHEQA